MKSKLRVATLLLTLGVASSACGTTYRADLQSLQGDPMAAPDVPGAELARSSEVHAEAGATGKATQAHFTAAYSVPAGGDKASVQREAVQQAQAAGWATKTLTPKLSWGQSALPRAKLRSASTSSTKRARSACSSGWSTSSRIRSHSACCDIPMRPVRDGCRQDKAWRGDEDTAIATAHVYLETKTFEEHLIQT